MDNQFEIEKEEELRKERWNQRIAEMKRQKERRERFNQNIKKYAVYGCGLLFAVIVIGVGTGIHMSGKGAEAQEMTAERTTEEAVAETVAGATEKEVEASIQSIPDGVVPKTSSVDNADATVAKEEESRVSTVETAEEDVQTNETIEKVTESGQIPVGDVAFQAGYHAEATEATCTIGQEDVLSEYAILLDASTGTIVAQRNAKTIINPASMTKILTVLVAAEHVTNLDDKFTITLEMTDYAYVNDCSSVGFLDGEVVTIRDLFYGTVLPSGGDAAVALATYVAGSQEAFVEMMNAKLEELGLSETAHFTNCVGLYDEEHYCSVYDMAMILKAAAENDLCREVLSARKYTTSATEQHPEGITISNWFLRRIEDKDTGGEVLCAKTGYVDQSGSCAASYSVSDEGVPYICVTAKTYSSWRCIYDHVALYSLYTE